MESVLTAALEDFKDFRQPRENGDDSDAVRAHQDGELTYVSRGSALFCSYYCQQDFFFTFFFITQLLHNPLAITEAHSKDTETVSLKLPSSKPFPAQPAARCRLMHSPVQIVAGPRSHLADWPSGRPSKNPLNKTSRDRSSLINVYMVTVCRSTPCNPIGSPLD